MRKCPIEFSCFGIQGAERKCAVTDPSDWDDLGIVPGGKDFVGFLEVRVGECLLDDGYTLIAQEADDSLTSNAGQKCPVREWSEHNSIFGHKDVGSGKFGDIAEHVTNDGIIEAARLRLKERPRVVGIKAAGLGIDRHRVQRWSAIGRQSN